MVRILGISAFYHDSAACFIVNGEIIAAAQKERFTRVKHDHRTMSDFLRGDDPAVFIYELSRNGCSHNHTLV